MARRGGGIVRIGLLGASRIAPAAVVEPARTCERAEVTAVAARDPRRAATFADQHRIPHVVDTYADLIASDLVDAIYVGLPPSAHAPWTIAALEAGTHVLCEKPFSCTTEEAVAMVAAAERTGLVLCEAYHWRYHPLADRLHQLLHVERRLGRLRHVEAAFDAPIPDLTDIRHDPRLGGGALMDLGCYPVQWARFVAGAEPEVERARAVEGQPGIDVSMEVELRFPEDLTALVTTSMDPDVEVRAVLRVEGEAGTLTVVNPLAPHLGHRLVLEADDGSTTETVDGGTTYDHQLQAFTAAILDGAPLPTGGADAVATMAVLEACYAAAGLPRRGA